MMLGHLSLTTGRERPMRDNHGPSVQAGGQALHGEAGNVTWFAAWHGERDGHLPYRPSSLSG